VGEIQRTTESATMKNPQQKININIYGTPPKDEPVKPSPPFKPFIGWHGDFLVLFTKEVDESTYAGIMLSTNGRYAPCEYITDSWDKQFVKPFSGTITIECRPKE